MNQELENKVPVAEQVEEMEQVDEAIEYSLNPDGSIAPEEK
jgi:tetrahydromethanopterin S-methyltransferase subunit B